MFSFGGILTGHKLICSIKATQFVINVFNNPCINIAIHVKVLEQISFKHFKTFQNLGIVPFGRLLSVNTRVLETFVIKVDFVFSDCLQVRTRQFINLSLMNSGLPDQLIFAIQVDKLFKLHEILRIDLLPLFLAFLQWYFGLQSYFRVIYEARPLLLFQYFDFSFIVAHRQILGLFQFSMISIASQYLLVLFDKSEPGICFVKSCRYDRSFSLILGLIVIRFINLL